MSNSLSIGNYMPMRWGRDPGSLIKRERVPFIDKEAPLLLQVSDVGCKSHLLVMKPFGKHGRDASRRGLGRLPPWHGISGVGLGPTCHGRGPTRHVGPLGVC